MALSVEYVVKETSTNLWRNWMVSLAAIVTVALSLSFVGDSLLFRQAVANATVRWQGGVTLAIFMRMDATQGQVEAIQPELAQNPQVKEALFCNQQCAYSEYQKIFAGDSNFLSAINSPTQLPVSYRVTLKNAATAESFGSQFKNQPGVDQVEYAKQQINNIVKFSRILQAVSLFIAAALLVSAIVLILNSIRLAIFARRKEVGVMKLVGATNWFIRIPFMAEGLIQGMVGAGLACLVMWYSSSKFHTLMAQNQTQLFGSFTVSPHNVVTTQILIIIFGGLVGAGGSAIALRRFLDV